MSCIPRPVIYSTIRRAAFSRTPRRMQLRFTSTFQEESIDRYCKGGYHPVRIGDTFYHDRYRIVNKLGHGVYSTVWLAFDHEHKRHVALKILTAESHGQGQDTFELDVLKHMKTRKRVPGAKHSLHLLHDYEHQGPNEKHVCLVSKAMGPDMSHYRRLFSKQRISLAILRDVSRQLLLALSYLHDTCRVIHTDIKPSNILVETSTIDEMFQKAPYELFLLMRHHKTDSSAEEDIARPKDLSVRLADFGTASWVDRHLTEWIQPQMLRVPGVILGASWDHKVDIWNLGLIIWELAEGQLLFDGCWTPQDDYTSEAHLAQMTAIFGNFPLELLERSKDRDVFFDVESDLLRPSPFPPCSLEQFSKSPDFLGTEREDFLGFIKSMVKLDPAERLNAHDLLQSPWLNGQR